MLKVIEDIDEWRTSIPPNDVLSVAISPDYVQNAARLEENGTAYLITWQDESGTIYHPIVRRKIPSEDNVTDLISPYEFGGFWFDTNDTRSRHSLILKFETAFNEYCRDVGVVSEFVRVHPECHFDTQRMKNYETASSAHHYVISLQDLSDDFCQEYVPSLRNKIRQAKKNGLSVYPTNNVDLFVEILHSNLDRLKSDPYYYFPREFFSSDSGVFRFFEMRDQSGEVCAAHCYLADGATLFAFQCHARPDKLHLRPNDLMYFEVAKWARQNGFQRPHLGGGNASLSRYKKKFSNETVMCTTVSAIFDDSLYQKLVGRQERRIGKSLEEQTFFPRYRIQTP